MRVIRQPHNRVNAGFTLIEILIVIVVIAILALLIIQRVNGAALKTREANMRSNLRSLREAVDLFSSDVGGYPLTLDQLMLSKADARTQLPDADASGNALHPEFYNGPYFAHTPYLPLDPLSPDGQWSYDPLTGHVASSATGSSPFEGTAYAGW